MEIITRPMTQTQQQLLSNLIAWSKSDPVLVTRYFDAIKYDLHSDMIAERSRELSKESAIVIVRPLQLLGYVREALIAKCGNANQELFATSCYWDTEIVAYSVTDGAYQRCWYVLRPPNDVTALETVFKLPESIKNATSPSSWLSRQGRWSRSDERAVSQ